MRRRTRSLWLAGAAGLLWGLLLGYIGGSLQDDHDFAALNDRYDKLVSQEFDARRDLRLCWADRDEAQQEAEECDEMRPAYAMLRTYAKLCQQHAADVRSPCPKIPFIPTLEP